MPEHLLTADERGMPDRHCLITVVGHYRRVDLAVPVNAPIAEYVMTIARLADQIDNGAPLDTFPADRELAPVWSLALTGRAPLPLDSSLGDAGVTDGEVLYLCDAADDVTGMPLVTDLDEIVDEEAERFTPAWTPRARAAIEVGAGIVWIPGVLGAFALFTRRMPADGPALLSSVGIGAAIVSVSMAAAARRRSWPMPAWLCTALAVSAIPELAVAGGLLSGSSLAPRLVVLTAAAGAVCGALLALAACPGPVCGGLAAALGLALIIAAALTARSASGAESAGVVAVAAVWLYDLAPAMAAWLVTRAIWSKTAAVAAQVRQTQVLVTMWQVALALAAGTALSWLADSRQAFAFALAGCVSLALLLAASSYRLLAAMLPGMTAGSAGILAALIFVPVRLGAPWWAAPAACALAGFALLGAGVGHYFAADVAEEESFYAEGGQSARPGPVPARSRVTIAAMLRVASILLLAGLFGAFAQLVSVGRGL